MALVMAVCCACIGVALAATDLRLEHPDTNTQQQQQPQHHTAQAPSTLHYFSVWQLESANTTGDMKGWTNFLFTSANTSDAIAYHDAGLGASLLHTTILPLIEGHVLFGVFLGDELCWNCISYANVSWAGALARRTLPARAVVYYNEAYPVFTDGVCGDGTPVHYTSVPDAFDWISIDYYPDEGTLEVCVVRVSHCGGGVHVYDVCWCAI